MNEDNKGHTEWTDYDFLGGSFDRGIENMEIAIDAISEVV